MNRRHEATALGIPARIVIMAAAIIALNRCELFATPIMTEGWDTVGNLSGWTTTGDGSLGNAAQYLAISFAAETVPVPGQDIFRTGPGSASGLTGNYIDNGAQAVTFRFLASDYTPDSLALYFASPTHVWSLALSTNALTVGTWTAYSASLSYDTGWIGGPGADAAAFALDLTSVDWIGVSIGRNNAGCDAPPAQSYGLDDFTAYTATPEPETYVLLLAAVAPLLVVFRKIRAGRA